MEPPLELLDGEHLHHAQIPDELDDAAPVGGAERAEDEGGEHEVDDAKVNDSNILSAPPV